MRVERSPALVATEVVTTNRAPSAAEFTNDRLPVKLCVLPTFAPVDEFITASRVVVLLSALTCEVTMTILVPSALT